LDFAPLFVAASRALPAPSDDVLLLGHWEEEEWRLLLGRGQPQHVRANEIIIRRGAHERQLFLVAVGRFEVGSSFVDGTSLTSLARIGAGSILGEQSFFDGLPRSASVWASGEGEVLRLEYEQYQAFAREHPALARDFVFAIGRVLSLRLRNTSVRVRR
jgi:CRP/FNR family cyclic AMP-dependent transcriptional regulator